MSLPQNYKQIAPNSQRLRASGGGSSDRMKDQNPFIHSPHGNPAFTPQKVGKSSSSASVDTRVIKAPKAPEKPLMPYMRYSRKLWDTVKNANPDLKLWEIGKRIGNMWRDLPEDDKQEFIEEYELEKIDYEKCLKIYHSSPAYVAYLLAKNKKTGKCDTDSHDPPRTSSKSQQQDRRIDIQPAEDEDDQDDGYSFKHVAYSRYLRNHRLINEIFSDAIVPDVRSVVTTQRMHVLKRQVQSLAMHQMKLQAELQQIEEKFENKKRKFVESSDLFQEELKKHCKPAVDDETFQKIIERQYEGLRRERFRAIEEQNLNKTPSKSEEQTEATPNSVQPAVVESEEAPLSEPSTSEPMDIEPPIKSADADDKSNELSNDSTASQPQQLQEMAKSVSVSKEPPASPVNDSASLIVNAPIPLATDVATPVTSVAIVVEPPNAEASLTTTAPITGPQAAVQPPNVTVPHHSIPAQPPHMASHAQYQYPGQGPPPRAPYYNIAPYNSQYSQYPYQYQQYGPHIAPSHPGYPGAAPAEAHPVYPPGQGVPPPTQQPLPATAQPLPQTTAPPPAAQEPDKKGN
ncbi:unnamed protein product [Diamesa tonsa]